jgi:hypothetical protein
MNPNCVWIKRLLSAVNNDFNTNTGIAFAEAVDPLQRRWSIRRKSGGYKKAV